MLTTVFPPVPAARVIITVVAALVLLATPITSAQAGRIRTTNCVGGWWWHTSCTTQWGEASDPYVRTLPAARSTAEDAELAERDRRWVGHCRPVLRQDRYGVERYQYAVPGCEYGRISE
jgi:hypothetical protein